MTNYTVDPVPGDEYEGRQIGYLIRKYGQELLKATTGGTGACWNVQPVGVVYGPDGAEEHEPVHICDLDEWIAALTALRDSEANKIHRERWGC